MMQELYALAPDRSAAFVRAFLGHFLPEPTSTAEGYPVPACAAMPDRVFVTDDEVMRYLEAHPAEDYSLYWHHPHDEGRMAMAFFTVDGALIVGLAEPESDARQRLRELAAFAGTSHAMLGWDADPANTVPDFIRECALAATLPRDSAATVELMDAVGAYVELQTRLVAALIEAHPSVLDPQPWQWPQRLTLEQPDGTWRFRRHGLGFRIESLADRTVVEAHRYVDTHPDAIDAFRLSTYLASRFIRRIRHDDGWIDAEHDAIAAALQTLARRGALTKIEPGSLPACEYVLVACSRGHGS
jgi:hypothetical protein